MNHAKKQIFKIAVISIIIFISILAVATMWLYSGRLTELKINIFTHLPLPIALVNNKAVTMTNYTLRWQTYLKLHEQRLSSLTTNQAKETIFAQIITDEQVTQISEKYNVTLSQKEIEAEYSEQFLSLGDNFENQLKTYGLTPRSYQQLVIKPQLLSVKLQTWFNSQEQLNKTQYELAKNLIEQINNGVEMAELAEQFSQDEIGKDIGGDMGFLDPVTLLSEMRESVYSLAIDEIKIIPNRFGINIIKLEQKQGNLLLLRQIYLQPEDFNLWFDQETKNFQIKKLINF